MPLVVAALDQRADDQQDQQRQPDAQEEQPGDGKSLSHDTLLLPWCPLRPLWLNNTLSICGSVTRRLGESLLRAEDRQRPHS